MITLNPSEPRRPAADPDRGSATGGPEGQRRLAALMQGLGEQLLLQFEERSLAPPRRQDELQATLLLGLELLWKIEEQVLLPALHAAAHEASPRPPALRQADSDIGFMRDLADLATRSGGSERETTLGVLEGLATLHVARMADLLGATPAGAADWPALEAEARALLQRWRHELRATGAIEDEDRDPVGLPPR